AYAIAFAEENWSGRRGSNPRPRPWQGRALPLSYTRILCRARDAPATAVVCQKRAANATATGSIDSVLRPHMGSILAKSTENAPEPPNRFPWIEIRPPRPNFRANSEAQALATC